MAGTRLFLQASLVLHIVVLVSVAFYFGLWDDHVARHVFGNRDARSRVVATDLLNAIGSISFPPVTLVCADSQVSFWSAYVKEFQQEHDIMQVKTHPELQSICREPSRVAVSEADVWICESVPPPQETRMVISNSSTILYSRGLKHRKEDLEHLYPDMTSQHHQDVVITLYIFSREDIPIWKAVAREWLRSSRVSDWPCVRNLRLRADHFDLFSVATETPRTSDESQNGTDDAAMPIEYQVSLDNVASGHLRLSSTSANTIHLSMFVPSRLPIVLDNSSSRTAQQGLHFVSVLAEPVTNNHAELLDQSLGGALEATLSRCMGMPSDLVNKVEIQSLDNSFPGWYTKLWFQRLLATRFQATIKLVYNQREELMRAAPTVHVSDAVVTRWLDAVELIQASQSLASRGIFPDAMTHLEQAHDDLVSIGRDPSLLEPHDFPMDQYSAVFAPLLFPLLLPLILGLRREYKRYRELSTKKDKKD